MNNKKKIIFDIKDGKKYILLSFLFALSIGQVAFFEGNHVHLLRSLANNNYLLLNRDSENYEPSLLQMKELYRQTKPWTGKSIRLLLLLFLLHTHVSVYLYTYLTLITVAIAVTRRTKI